MFIKKFKKKRHFKQMLQDIEKVIAETEFKKFKTIYARENTRKQYDRVKEAILNAENNKANKDEVKKLKDSQEKLEVELKEIDSRIQGAQPTKENPEGVTGIDQQLAGFVELRELTKSYLKEYC